MNKRFFNKYRHIPFHLLVVTVFLSACGSSDASTSIDSGSSSSSSGQVRASTKSGDVPEELISYEDTSLLIDAVNRDLDPDFYLLRTTFYCYLAKPPEGIAAGDYSRPHLTFTFRDDEFQFESIGAKPMDVSGTLEDKPNSDSFYLTSGTERTRFRLQFDEYGQSFTVPKSSPEITCYQSGASHNRALHQFLLNTPEPGSYNCNVWNDGKFVINDQPLTIIEGNQYSFIRSTGTFQYEGVFEGQESSVSIRSGMLEKLSGEYQEDPNSGRQLLAFVKKDKAGMVCDRQRKPRPFKRYGAETISPPPVSSVPLTGVYFLDNGNDQSMGWAEFTADGFFYTEGPVPGGINCRRTLPNGLPPCSKFQYDGRSMKISRFDKSTTARVSHGSDGSVKIGPILKYNPVRIPRKEELLGKWVMRSAREQTAIDTSMCIMGYCNSRHSSVQFQFFEDGQFTFGSSSSGNSSVNIPGVDFLTSALSNQNSSGTYQIDETELVLTYPNSRPTERIYLHLISENKLAADSRVYWREK